MATAESDEPADVLDQPSAPVAAGDHLRAVDVAAIVAVSWAGLVVASIAFVGQALVRGATLEPTPTAVLVTAGFDAALTLGACWLFACRLRGRTLASGLALVAAPRGSLLWSSLLGVALSLVGSVLAERFGSGESLIGEMASTTSGRLVLTSLALTVPFAEEAYYRSVLFPALRRLAGVAAGVLLSTLWFGMAHWAQLVGGDAIALVPILGMGAAAAIQRHRHDSLWPALAVHLGYNGTAIGLGWIT